MADTSVHYFIVMLRMPGRCLFTQMVSTHDAMVRGVLDFPNLIKINDIHNDFQMDLDIYGMVSADSDYPVLVHCYRCLMTIILLCALQCITREPMATPKKKKGLTPSKKKSKTLSHAMQSPGGPYAVRTTNFTLLSSLPLGLGAVDRTHFTLNRVPYSCPLQGTVQLKMRCLMESHVEHRGFLVSTAHTGATVTQTPSVVQLCCCRFTDHV